LTFVHGVVQIYKLFFNLPALVEAIKQKLEDSFSSSFLVSINVKEICDKFVSLQLYTVEIKHLMNLKDNAYHFALLTHTPTSHHISL
jgi:hypothetical protein